MHVTRTLLVLSHLSYKIEIMIPILELLETLEITYIKYMKHSGYSINCSYHWYNSIFYLNKFISKGNLILIKLILNIKFNNNLILK